MRLEEFAGEADFPSCTRLDWATSFVLMQLHSGLLLFTSSSSSSSFYSNGTTEAVAS